MSISVDKTTDLVRSLLKWHKDKKRHYPWREESSPYRILVAELMLQRTRADQVVPVYNKFIKRYPDVKSLAQSDLEDIQYLIKPLGLLWRAANFKKAAEYILKEHGGIVPPSVEELSQIPGVGEYVGGAIYAVAFSKSTSIVDSNIARIINRYFGLELNGEIRRNRKVNDISGEIFKKDDPKKILFAIIDFGALVCTAANPKHEECPLRTNCIYYIKHKARVES